MVAIIHKRSWRDFDWILALLAIAIVAFGTIQIRYAQPTETYLDQAADRTQHWPGRDAGRSRSPTIDVCSTGRLPSTSSD